MADIRLERLELFRRNEIASFGRELHESVTKEAVEATLRARNLGAVVMRHGVSPEKSISKLVEARDLIDENFQAYMILKAGRAVGMGTVQRGLPLYRQLLPLPPRLTRNNVLGRRVETPLANVAAWTDTARKEANFFDDMTEAYSFLRAIEPYSWTLVTGEETSEMSAYAQHHSLAAAGYHPKPVTLHRYDDMESSLTPAPYSQLYISNDVQ